jgi:hypothetical protein
MRKVIAENHINVFEKGDTFNINGTYKVGGISGVTYNELVEILGEPTFDEASGDNKVQKEWVCEYDGNVFTIYDWKTFDEEYTMNELTMWSVGGKDKCSDFIDALQTKHD